MQRRENRKFNRRGQKPKSEYDSKLLDLTRVTRVTAGGKQLRFRAVIVVGNKKGKVGVGVSKGQDVQQAVEKALKAHLTEKERDFKRIHNLIDLNAGIKKIGYKLSLKEEEAVFLNSVYRARYPADLGLLPYGEPNIVDAQKALKIAVRLTREINKFLP